MSTTLVNVRLSAGERDSLRRAVSKACAEVGVRWSRIILFGSRAEASRLGGDIDILIELAPHQHCDVFRLTQRMRIAIENELGEQRVDLVVDDGTPGAAFASLARLQGIELWSNN